MPAVSALVGYGQGYSTAVSAFMLDESEGGSPYLLMQSLTISATREEHEYKSANRCAFALEYANFKADFAFDGYVLRLVDLALSHPGSNVTSANVSAGTYHGSDSADGVHIYMDPVTTGSAEEMRKLSFTIRHFPFVAAS